MIDLYFRDGLVKIKAAFVIKLIIAFTNKIYSVFESLKGIAVHFVVLRKIYVLIYIVPFIRFINSNNQTVIYGKYIAYFF